MARVTVYSTNWCGFCERAKALLRQRGIEFQEVSLDDSPGFRERVFELSGRFTVPLITIDDRPVGGYSELRELDRSGGLDDLQAA
jgi:glutaredoxin 3